MRSDDDPPSFLWITLNSPNIVEMVGALGVRAVFLDLEHTGSTIAEVQHLIVAAQGAGMAALVRVGGVDQHEIARLLDIGAQGIVFPRVSSVAQAVTAAESLRYPPVGVRGFAAAHARSVRWTGAAAGGGQAPELLTDSFLRAVDAEIASIFMIEDPAGADAVDAILDAGRPDGVVFGWADYAVCVGFDRDRVTAARARVVEACRTRGIGVAVSAVPSDGVEFYRGCFYSAGVDATLFSAAMVERIAAVRAAISARSRA